MAKGRQDKHVEVLRRRTRGVREQRASRHVPMKPKWKETHRRLARQHALASEGAAGP